MTKPIERIGKAVLSGVFIGVPVLMFVPQLYLTWDANTLSSGDAIKVWTPGIKYSSGLSGGNRKIETIKGDLAKVVTDTGDSAWVPVKYLKEK